MPQLRAADGEGGARSMMGNSFVADAEAARLEGSAGQ